MYLKINSIHFYKTEKNTFLQWKEKLHEKKVAILFREIWTTFVGNAENTILED